MAGPCEHGNEPLSSIKCGNFRISGTGLQCDQCPANDGLSTPNLRGFRTFNILLFLVTFTRNEKAMGIFRLYNLSHIIVVIIIKVGAYTA